MAGATEGTRGDVTSQRAKSPCGRSPGPGNFEHNHQASLTGSSPHGVASGDGWSLLQDPTLRGSAKRKGCSFCTPLCFCCPTSKRLAALRFHPLPFQTRTELEMPPARHTTQKNSPMSSLGSAGAGPISACPPFLGNVPCPQSCVCQSAAEREAK
jgi:hypothetical protein